MACQSAKSQSQTELKDVTHHPKGSSANVGPRFLTSSEVGPAPRRVGDLVAV